MIVEGIVKKWGGSTAIVVEPRLAKAAHLKPGQRLNVQIIDAPLDRAGRPFFHDAPDASVNHANRWD